MDSPLKHPIYIRILWHLLPHARNVHTWGRFRRFFHGDIYAELELVHNIPPLLEYPEMRDTDVYWLNTQARNYAAACSVRGRPHSVGILELINELVELVPSTLQHKLQWRGGAGDHH